ncbi:MAG: SAM-dependent methyltransferase [Acidimicrobiaceae bacterium]|nr:SAM-dependent methyltransferase [Acidimicrobiaceae bacterium]
MAGPGEADPYLLGTDAVEERRLESQHQVWAAHAANAWDRAGFGPGQRLLDLGCGPGFAAIDLARRVGPDGHVLAVDESARFIEGLTRRARGLGLPQLSAHLARVEEVRLEPASLDGLFARWLFCFLPDPAAALERVVPALRPGGRLVIWDYLNYHATTLYPPSPAFDRLIVAVQDSWRRSGGDLNVGARLPALLAGAGCRIRELVPVVEYAPAGSPFWTWPRTFFFPYATRLVEEGLLSGSDRDAFESEWLERETTPGAFLCAPPMLAIIAER